VFCTFRRGVEKVQYSFDGLEWFKFSSMNGTLKHILTVLYELNFHPKSRIFFADSGNLSHFVSFHCVFQPWKTHSKSFHKINCTISTKIKYSWSVPPNYCIIIKIQNFLKVPSGQIGSAWEWYHWIGLEKDINSYMFLIF
jgi:hypothetical protein